MQKLTTETTVSDYISWLLKTNRQQFGENLNTPILVSSFAFGLIEELRELLAADTQEKKLLELGDLVAYYCLLSASLLQSVDVLEQDLLHAEQQLHTQDATDAYLGSAKRFFRGDGTDSDLLQQAYAVLRFGFFNTSLSIEPVVEANKRKLEARLSNTGTFLGSGDR